MGLLCTIILILFSAVDHPRYQLSMRNRIAAQLISNNLSRLTAM
jgi:hypothetical protein